MLDLPSSTVRPIIAWSDILLVGHAQIDADHRRLFEIADRLHAGIRDASKDVLVRDVMGELMNYTLTHFAREEALMKAASLPGLEDHRFEHELITYRLRNLMRDAQNGRQGIAEQLEIFLDRWLARHILTSDLQTAAALRQAQAAPSAG